MSQFDKLKSQHKAGDCIFRDGEIGTQMYILQSGKVELVKEVLGRDEVIATLEKGDFFGEMAVLENLPRNMTARVVEDAEVIAINGTVFDKMIKSNIEIAVRMLRKFSGRLREADAENLRMRQVNRELEARPAAGASEPIAAPAPPLAATAAPAAKPAPARPRVAARAPAAKAPASPPAAQPAAAAVQPPHGILVVKGTNKTFEMRGDEITIGRADPVTGLHPDVDLSAEDMNRFISRRHAKILRKEGSYFLVEEVGVTNGTYLNGKRLQAGVYSSVNFGDELCFGKVFVTFEKPGS